jgi:hypothetical protein
MEGQADRQPISVNDAAAAIESLMSDDGDLLSQDQPEEVEEEEPEASDDESDSAEESADQDSDEDEAEAEPEETTLETLDDIAKALGVDAEALLANLKMKIKVNGEERLVSLKEAQTGHQLEADYRRKTTELAEQRRAVEQDFAQRQALYHQQSVEAANVLQMAEQAVLADLNTPQMAALREKDPVQWMLRRDEAQQKLAYLQQTRQQAATQWQMQQQHSAAEQQRQFQAYLQQEQSELERAVSQRGEQLTGEAKAGLATFLVERYGFSPEEVGQVYNHRLVLLALDAMRATAKVKDMDTKAAQVKEKVTTLPKVIPPGKAQGKVQVKQKVIAGLKGRLKQTGSVRDAAAVIERLM